MGSLKKKMKIKKMKIRKMKIKKIKIKKKKIKKKHFLNISLGHQSLEGRKIFIKVLKAGRYMVQRSCKIS
jgi:hypothetical protein